MIIGFDVATTTGFSVINKGKIIETGLIQLDLKSDYPARFKDFYKSVGAIIKRVKPKVLVMEATYVGPNIKTTAYLNMLGGNLILATPKKCELHRVVVSSIRKQVLGRGDAKKEKIFEWATATYQLENLDPEEKGTFDITDSILLAHWGYLVHSKQIELD